MKSKSSFCLSTNALAFPPVISGIWPYPVTVQQNYERSEACRYQLNVYSRLANRVPTTDIPFSRGLTRSTSSTGLLATSCKTTTTLNYMLI